MKWLILFLPVLAFASDDERGPNVDVDVKTITKTSVATGDVSTGDMNVENTLMGSNSDVITTVLGDVDIADCLYSWQVIIVQGVAINKFCQYMELARDQHLLGNFLTEARIKCQVGIIQDLWENERECVEAVRYRPPSLPPAPVPVTVVPDQHLEESASIHTEQQQEFESLEQRLARIEAGQRNAARRAAEKRVYVQQTLEELQDDNDPEE